MTSRITLTRGFVTIVDDGDYNWLSSKKWMIRAAGEYLYAGRRVNQQDVLMHRVVLGVENEHRSVYVDHINGDTLDNRRSNLRICDNTSNQGNRKRQGGTSRFRGVCWQKNEKRWRAAIKMHGKTVSLGTYGLEEDAARAYNAAAIGHFGKFAKLNILE